MGETAHFLDVLLSNVVMERVLGTEFDDEVAIICV